MKESWANDRTFARLTGWIRYRSSGGEKYLFVGEEVADAEDRDPEFWRRVSGEFIWIRSSPEHIEIRRDAVGIRPLYYRRRHGRLEFSTLFRDLDDGGSLNEEYLRNLGRRDFRDLGATAWREVRRLLPGHRLLFNGERLTVERWYRLPESAAPHTEDSLKRGLAALLDERARLPGRSAIFVSGGLDSALLFQHWRRHARGEAFHLAGSDGGRLVRELLEGSPVEMVGLEEAAADFGWQSFRGRTRALYTPTLALFVPLLERARRFGAEVVWTGLGGDDIHTLPAAAFWPCLWSGDLTGARALVESDGEGWRTALRLARSFVRGLAPFSESLVSRVLRRRLFIDGLLQTGIEFEQELAQEFGLWMTYPLLDIAWLERLMNCPVRLFQRGGEDKWILRASARERLGDRAGRCAVHDYGPWVRARIVEQRAELARFCRHPSKFLFPDGFLGESDDLWLEVYAEERRRNDVRKEAEWRNRNFV